MLLDAVGPLGEGGEDDAVGDVWVMREVEAPQFDEEVGHVFVHGQAQ